MKTRRLEFEFLILATFLLLFSLWTVLIAQPFTSDDIAQQNIVATFSTHSRPLIDLPQNTYLLKFPLYLLAQWLPVSQDLKLVAAVLALNLTALVLVWWAIRSLIGGKQKNWLGTAIPLLWLASLGGSFATALGNPNSRNLELGLGLAGLALAARWYQRSHLMSARQLATGRTAAWFIGTILLTGLFFYNDPYFVYTLGLPLLLFFGANWLWYERDDKALLLACGIVGAIVAEVGWHWLFWLAGIHAGGSSATFATLPEALNHIGLFATGALDIFNASFFGQPVMSVQTFGRILNFLTLTGTLLAPLLLLWPRFRQKIWNVFFVLLPPFLAVTFIFSGQPVDLSSERYLVWLPFYSLVIATLALTQLQTARRRGVLMAGLLMAAALNVTATVQAYGNRDVNPNAENKSTALTFKNLGLTKGYAGYWDAGINQYFSGEQVYVIPAGCSARTGVKLNRTLLNEQELARPAHKSFYLFDSKMTHCTEADFGRFLGSPQQTIGLGDGKTLLVYDYDITSRLKAH